MANLLGIIVQLSYGLYGGAVTSMVGFLLLSHKTFLWNDKKDGEISHFKKQEITITTVGIFIGLIVLGILYCTLFKGEQPIWLISLNGLLFVLGTGGRILLINGKTESQLIYVAREFVDLAVLISMISLQITNDSLWIRLSSVLSSMIILFKSNVNWLHYANDKDRKSVV